jgi:hypothetical protein
MLPDIVVSPFFACVLALVIPGALIVLLAALVWTRRTGCRPHTAARRRSQRQSAACIRRGATHGDATRPREIVPSPRTSYDSIKCFGVGAWTINAHLIDLDDVLDEVLTFLGA